MFVVALVVSLNVYRIKRKHMKTKDQKGFTHNVVLAALSVLVLGAIGFAGVRVYQNSSSSASAAGWTQLVNIKDTPSSMPGQSNYYKNLFTQNVASAQACRVTTRTAGIVSHKVRYEVVRKTTAIPGISVIALNGGQRLNPQPYSYVKEWTANKAVSEFTLTDNDQVQFFMDYAVPTGDSGGLPLVRKSNRTLQQVESISPKDLKRC